MQDGRKAAWIIPYVSVAFFPRLKQNFIAYRSSKVSDCIFEIYQQWQSGFSRVYSKSLRQFYMPVQKKVWKLIEGTTYIYIYIYIYIYLLISLVGRVFANGPGDQGSIPGRALPKSFKMTLDTSLLNTQQYKVRIKGKAKQSKERSSALPYTSVSLLWKREPSGHPRLWSPTLLLLLYMYLYKINSSDWYLTSAYLCDFPYQ